MNVLMIHGIKQENKTGPNLRKIWMDVLTEAQPGLLDGANVEMAYYGEILADWANGKTTNAVGMGSESVAVDLGDQNELNFISSVLEEVAKDQDITEEKIQEAKQDSQGDLVAMDNFIYRRINDLLRAIEYISPLHGSLLLRVIKQGHTYLSMPAAQKAVDDIVKPYLKRSPQILITHSLGTVIAFKLLREMADKGESSNIPLLITMGSPLALDAFKKNLGPPRRKAPFVKRWVNFYDPSDFVTLGKPLNAENFASEIENDGTVNNTTANCHGVVKYLPHPGVIEVLNTTFKNGCS